MFIDGAPSIKIDIFVDGAPSIKINYVYTSETKQRSHENTFICVPRADLHMIIG